VEPARTVEQFMEALTPARRAAAGALRETVLANLPAGFEETLDYGMLSYGTASEPGGRGRLALLSIADHGPYMALYVNCVERGGEEALYARWRASGTPLETGSRAIRFRGLDELALGVVADWVAAADPAALRAAFARARGR
jgi:hypothetical protein